MEKEVGCMVEAGVDVSGNRLTKFFFLSHL